jgi:DNA repair exonuclease SbcCD ATPase subunit
MKTQILPGFALFIAIAVLLSGCGKANTKLASGNASLKARVQTLESQLQASKNQIAPQGSDQASTQDLKSQLDEAQKKAEAAANELQSVTSQVETQKEIIISLTRQLSDAQQAREKAVKDLQLYQDKATSALKEFKALRSTLDDKTAGLDGYHQYYLATQMVVTNLVDALPESQVRRAILGVLATFTRADDTWETADRQMQERTRQARFDYDQFVNANGIGPIPYLENIGKARLLAPAETENAAIASNRDQKIISFEPDLDLEIKNLQDLVNG